MSQYRIAWLPGDGVGKDVMDASRIVLDVLKFDAEYVHGDIGWDFWCAEGDAFPQRTVDLLGNVHAAMFGAITSKPLKAAEAESESIRAKGKAEAAVLKAKGEAEAEKMAPAKPKRTKKAAEGDEEAAPKKKKAADDE